MIYQSIINTASSGGYLWVVWLIAALFGSALTLASFMKLVHAVFLGQPSGEEKALNNKRGETTPAMWIPQVSLALLCLIFGVFAYQIPLKIFILPSLGGEVEFLGIWNASLATVLIIVGIVIGMIIYLLGKVTKAREVGGFVGGENLEKHPQMRISGTEFYNTIQEMGILKIIYELAKKKVFDLYDIGRRVAFVFVRILRYIHNGVLPTYMAWCLLGMIILFYALRG